MKVIIVSPSLRLEDNISGISSVVRLIIENCKSIDFIHFRLGKKDKERGGFWRIFSLIFSLLRWFFLLLRERNAIIHYNLSLDLNAILRDSVFISLAALFGRSMVLHIHGGRYMNKDCHNKFVKKFFNSIFSHGFPLIVLSDIEKERISKKTSSDNIHVLPNIVYIPEVMPDCKLRKEDKIHFLYLGRIERNKGIGEILSAFSAIKQERNDFVLHMAGAEQGNESYINLLKTSLGNNYIYEGIVGGSKKDKLLNDCHVFVLPSYYEGLPMALLEAMAYRQMVIATSVGSIGKYVKQGKNGFIVESGNALSLQNAILNILEDKEIIISMSANAYQTIKNCLSKEKYMTELTKIYTSLTTNK